MGNQQKRQWTHDGWKQNQETKTGNNGLCKICHEDVRASHFRHSVRIHLYTRVTLFIKANDQIFLQNGTVPLRQMALCKRKGGRFALRRGSRAISPGIGRMSLIWPRSRESRQPPSSLSSPSTLTLTVHVLGQRANEAYPPIKQQLYLFWAVWFNRHNKKMIAIIF